MNLPDLARLILILNQGPISRIRFSRTVYFVHKELVRKKLMRAEDIAYLRLPLGPAPEGLLELAAHHPDIIIRPLTGSNLSYEAEEFAIPEDQDSSDIPAQVQRTIRRTLLALQSHPTSELVAASHDHSWTTHQNGERYYLTPADLKNTFPFLTISFRLRFLRPTNNEIGLLQATLLRGMLGDIVRESTDLEYPDEAAQPTKPSQPAEPSQSAKPKPATKPQPTNKPAPKQPKPKKDPNHAK